MNDKLQEDLQELAMYRACGLTAVEVNKLVKWLRNFIEKELRKELRK